VEPPDGLAVPRVQGPRASGAGLYPAQAARSAAAAGREVDEAGEHRRRTRDRGRSAEAPAHVTRARVECDEVAVPRADEDRLAPDRRRRVDVRAHSLRPEQVPASGAERVDGAVGVPDEDAVVGNCGRRIEVLAAPETGERRGTPPHPAGATVHAVDAPVARGDEDDALRVCGRGDDLVVGPEGPAYPRALLASQLVGVEVVVPGAEIEPATDKERRRLDRAHVHAPVLVPRPCVPRDHEAPRAGLVLAARQRVHVRLVHDPLVDRRRGCGTPPKALRPDDLARSRFDREEPALLLRDVDLPVGDRGRKLDIAVRLQPPEPVVGRAQRAPPGSEMRALGVVAVGRPLHPVPQFSLVLLLDPGPERGPQGVRELDCRRAAHGPRPFLVPGPRAEDGPDSERDERESEDQQAQHADPVQERRGEREHGTRSEQELRGFGDRAFERCGERDDPAQVNDGSS